MAELSLNDKSTIKEHPLAGSLVDISELLEKVEDIYELCQDPSGTTIGSPDRFYRNTLSRLLFALQGGDAVFNLRSRIASLINQ